MFLFERGKRKQASWKFLSFSSNIGIGSYFCMTSARAEACHENLFICLKATPLGKRILQKAIKFLTQAERNDVIATLTVLYFIGIKIRKLCSSQHILYVSCFNFEDDRKYASTACKPVGRVAAANVLWFYDVGFVYHASENGKCFNKGTRVGPGLLELRMRRR